jgi:dGTPase
VEAAALAHDLGHPPFGHIAEQELDSLARANNAPEGFEGNAQSFRILNRTEAHRHGYRGLDLTRATLNAVLKYPWLRDTRAKGADSTKAKKFGAYSSEIEAFEFARAGFEGSDRQSIEAAIMDHADAIAYSVHDLDDFYRAGLIPVEVLVFGDHGEWEWFIERWKRIGTKIPADDIDAGQETFLSLLSEFTVGSHYTGEYEHRAHVRTATSRLINRFIHGVRLEGPKPNASGLWRDPAQQNDLEFLQALIWVYVIKNPRLATQQHGQRAIIRALFGTYLTAIKQRNSDFVPALFRADVDALPAPPKLRADERNATEEETRIAVDIIASFTDAQAVLLHRRLSGMTPGSITELLHA